MSLRLLVRVVVIFLVAGGLLISALFGSSLLENSQSATVVDTENAIVRENTQQGTFSWKIPAGFEASTQIQAYASATYVAPGMPITFYVSTQKEGTQYSIYIYRLGWYGGFGGRLMASSLNDQIGHMQGYYDSTSRKLVACKTCFIDGKTNLIEANWQPSYTLGIPPDWTTGIYLAKFIDANGLQTYTPFDVTGNDTAKYLAVTPDTTYAAYNSWGGFSIDNIDNSLFTVKASFDRPYVQEDGSSQVLIDEADTIHWMERQGYDLSYTSNVSLQEDPGQLLQHRAYISLGHDEYWTKEMRDSVQNARDKGVGLAFLGANDSFWQMRFEPNHKGVADRTVICYKVLSVLNDLARDPFYNKDNTRLTTQWRDPVLALPENALIGVMYDDQVTKKIGFSWQVSWKTKSILLKGTGLQTGQQYGCDLVGPRWDRVYVNGATPAGLQVLATSSTRNDSGIGSTSDTTYYIASSGAMVFATGSLNWTYALDSYRLNVDKACVSQTPEIPAMQSLMAHVMSALIVLHSSQQLASLSNTGKPSVPVELFGAKWQATLKKRGEAVHA